MKIEVFVGSNIEQRLAYEVLKSSIYEHADLTDNQIDIFMLQDYVPNDVSLSTPFTLQRFYIPALVSNTTDYAIYLDSDMVVFDSIINLINESKASNSQIVGVSQPEDSLRGNQSSVIVFKKGSFGISIEEVSSLINGSLCSSNGYKNLLVDFEPFGGIEYSISSRWNSLEYFCDSETALLHYTDMETQPWLSSVSPLAPAWEIMLANNKAIQKKYIYEDISSGFVKPSLLNNTSISLLKELFWYPPGNIPTKRPNLWKAMRYPFVGPFVCFFIRTTKAFIFKRERKVYFLLLKLIFRINQPKTQSSKGVFNSYD